MATDLVHHLSLTLQVQLRARHRPCVERRRGREAEGGRACERDQQQRQSNTRSILKQYSPIIHISTTAAWRRRGGHSGGRGSDLRLRCCHGTSGAIRKGSSRSTSSSSGCGGSIGRNNSRATGARRSAPDRKAGNHLLQQFRSQATTWNFGR